MPAPLARDERARLIKVAKRRAAKHWPNKDGRCPACNLKDCEPFQTAQRFLEAYSEPPDPILKA
ncbi:hypothetical protein [Micromonospora sp. NPDC047730]|uniref:hypothetical protein n=1 Tax=Micromonospora sp. NPDC047730 TaxID=3364253 RepID=UPI00371C694E